MPTESPRVLGRVPNRLKQTRRAIDITQEQLKERCGALSDSDPGKYSTISVSTIVALERGYQHPQQKTARTLAMALDAEVEALFPLGWDDPNHNPGGNTKITPDRKKGGRPPKH